MGGKPPVWREHEQDRSDAPAPGARGHWFARLLGEEWRAEGHGIYRYVGGAAGAESSAESRDDLVGALAPLRRLERRGEDAPAPPPGRPSPSQRP